MASIKVKPMHKGAKMVLENFSTQIADTFSTEVFGRMMLGIDLARLSLKMAISRPKDIGGITAYLDGGHSTITLRWSLKVTL